MKFVSSLSGSLDFDLFAGFDPLTEQKTRYFFAEANPFIHRSDFENVMVLDHRSMPAARACLCYDDPNDGKIGYFACLNDQRIFEEFMEWIFGRFRSKGITKIIAPMSFSSWFDYRFLVSDQSGSLQGREFFLEPYNEKYYPCFFQQAGFTKFRHYYTFICDKACMQSIVKRSKRWYDLSISKKFSIRNFQTERMSSELESVYSIFSRSFGDFPGSASLSLEEFAYYIKPLEPSIHSELVKFICDPSGIPVGLIAGYRTLPDENLISLVYIASISNQEVFCSNALSHQFGLELLAKGHDRVCLSLVAENSPALFYTRSAEPVREYCLYEKVLQ